MDDLVYRLRKRAEIRRQIDTRKSVQEGKPDRIADLLEEAADHIEKREWVGLTEEELDEAMKYWSDDSRSTYGGARIADGEYVNMRDTWRDIEAKLKEKNT